MHYGKAFKTIRLIKDIREIEAAEALGIDKRTLYDIESERTHLVSDRFEQMLKYYKVSHEVVLDLAKDPSNFNNIINDAQRDAIVVNQGSSPTVKDAEIEALKGMIEHLKANDQFQKNEIDRLMKMIEVLVNKHQI